MSIRSSLLATLLLGTGLAGCQQSHDIGADCVLVRRNPDGGVPIQLTEADLDEGVDFVSYGSVECDDLVCIRDRGFTRTSSGGYCSRSCIPGSTSLATGCVAAPENDDPARPFSCRPLGLDEETIAIICNENPALCAQLPADTSPYYCAQHPLDTDGGS